MQCKDIMTKSVKICDKECTAKDAAQIMKKVNTGLVPVVDNNDKILGVVTDRDITLKSVAENKDPSKMRIHDFMTKHVVKVHEEDLVDDAIRKMKENKVRRLLVVDDEDKLSGIISLGDIAVLSDIEEHEVIESLREISAPVSGSK